MQNRRHLLTVCLAAGAAFAGLFHFGRGRVAAAQTFKVSFSEEEWKKKLTADQFAVLRQEGTERPFTSALEENKTPGLYHCAGCDTPVYSSDKKFDSGTGWPSFTAAISGNVANRRDFKLIYPRTEEHCATCGGHLGHVFDDGPAPTGKRHCINGVALVFRAGETAS